MVKFILVGAIAAAEQERNPISLLSKSWAMTKGNSFRIFGLVVLVAIAGWVASAVVSMIFGLIFSLVLPASVAKLGIMVVDTAAQVALSVVLLHVYMAIYRAVSARR